MNRVTSVYRYNLQASDHKLLIATRESRSSVYAAFLHVTVLPEVV